MKKCNKCGNEKELTEFFFRKDSQKYRNECKVCFTESNKINRNVESMKEYNKQYIKINSEKIKEYKKQYYDNNKEKILENRKQYYNDNIEKVKKYRKENKIILSEKQKIYYQNRLKNDIIFKTKENIRKLIQLSFKRNGFTKKTKTHQILGCTFEEFKQHLESKFEDWMTWDNYGLYNGELNYGWDIDHIIPSSSATSEKEIIKLNHFTNLQPLCSKINRDIKINKVG
jgi:hypothetical protein